jgi:V-type H+-transporting ATPase subunit d
LCAAAAAQGTTDYGHYLQNEPSPLYPATIVEKCTAKLVEEWNHLRCQARPFAACARLRWPAAPLPRCAAAAAPCAAPWPPRTRTRRAVARPPRALAPAALPPSRRAPQTLHSLALALAATAHAPHRTAPQAVEPLATFLDYCTYGYMIDNVVLIVAGTLHEREMADLLAKCHPLGMFDSIATLAVATTMRELYRLVLVDTPLAPYFSGCISSEDLDEMNIEVMRATLYKAYLEDFAALCARMGGATATLMGDLLSFEADRRAVAITINSLGTELSRDDRRKLFPAMGALHPYGHAELMGADDMESVRGAVEKYPTYGAIFAKVPFGGDATALDKAFYEEEVRKHVLMFEQQFHYGVFYGYLKLREQEIRNLMWVAECVAQGQHARVHDGIVGTF